MRVVLINPNLVAQKTAPCTSGFVYMPIGLAYLAASLRERWQDVTVIDAYGSQPDQVRREEQFLLFGLEPSEVAAQIPEDAGVVFLQASQVDSARSVLAIIKAIKLITPDLPVVVLENQQAVPPFPLKPVDDVFFAAGADYVLTGEIEQSVYRVSRAIVLGTESVEQIPGLCGPRFANAPARSTPLSDLPYPAWDLFPLRGYWSRHFANGPQTGNRYLPLLTSRPATYGEFSVVSATAEPDQQRSPESVVAEMELMKSLFQVREFHIEDVDPTLDENWLRGLCKLVLHKKLSVAWKIVADVPIEAIGSEETVDLLARAGCRYLSLSVESGSPRVLEEMGKGVHTEQVVRLIRRMNKVGIRSQACFLLGYPGETDEDRDLTRDLVELLTRRGVDEVALSVLPTSSALGNIDPTLDASTEDPALARFCSDLSTRFVWWKLYYQPGKIVRQFANFVLRRFETRMEMTPYRVGVFRFKGLFAQPIKPAVAVEVSETEVAEVPTPALRRAA